MMNNEHMIPVILKNVGESVLNPNLSQDQRLMYEAMLIAARKYCDDILLKLENNKNKKPARK